jgi:outer membrane lipoprotein-sorting protein
MPTVRNLLIVNSFCLLTAAFSWNASAAVDEKALAVLEKTSAYYQALENFQATYTLTIQYPSEDITQSSKLSLTARGQQYKWSYDQRETITDGETIWVYDKEIQEVTISDYATTDCAFNFAELYNLYQQGYEPHYLKERILKNKKKKSIRDVIRLIPKQEDSIFQHITIEIDRATAQIHGWEMVQTEETRYICTLCSFAANLPLPDNCFTFDPATYQGVEVIDLRQNEPETETELEHATHEAEVEETDEEKEGEGAEEVQTNETH